MILFVLLPLVVVIGALSGFAAFMKLRIVLQRLDELESRIDQSIDTGSATTSTEPEKPELVASKPKASESDAEKPEFLRQATKAVPPAPEPVKRSVQPSVSADVKAEPSHLPTGKPGIDWYALLQQYWMVILGGI